MRLIVKFITPSLLQFKLGLILILTIILRREMNFY